MKEKRLGVVGVAGSATAGEVGSESQHSHRTEEGAGTPWLLEEPSKSKPSGDQSPKSEQILQLPASVKVLPGYRSVLGHTLHLRAFGLPTAALFLASLWLRKRTGKNQVYGVLFVKEESG